MSTYILNENGEPIAEPDIMKWTQWFDKAERHVGYTTIGDSTISTVFLGVNHSFASGAPVVWETVVFCGKLNQERKLCSGSREQAEAMHARMVEKVKRANG